MAGYGITSCRSNLTWRFRPPPLSADDANADSVSGSSAHDAHQDPFGGRVGDRSHQVSSFGNDCMPVKALVYEPDNTMTISALGSTPVFPVNGLSHQGMVSRHGKRVSFSLQSSMRTVAADSPVSDVVSSSARKPYPSRPRYSASTRELREHDADDERRSEENLLHPPGDLHQLQAIDACHQEIDGNECSPGIEAAWRDGGGSQESASEGGQAAGLGAKLGSTEPLRPASSTPANPAITEPAIKLPARIAVTLMPVRRATSRPAPTK